MQTFLIFKVDYVCNNQQRVKQGQFNLYYNSLLLPHTDVILTLTPINELESNFVF